MRGVGVSVCSHVASSSIFLKLRSTATNNYIIIQDKTIDIDKNVYIKTPLDLYLKKSAISRLQSRKVGPNPTDSHRDRDCNLYYYNIT